MKSLANGERIGDWIVESRLGEGAMATVYRCRHALSGRLTAAVKLLRPEVPGDNADKWFLREIETLASLTHPGIVRILHPGHDKERGAYFLAMELIAGRCRVRLKGESQWIDYAGGQSFSVPGDSAFDIETLEDLHYVCHFG
jgi:uncharacterized protein YaiE (UPF0345 family)